MLYEVKVKLGSVLSQILEVETYYCELVGLSITCAYCPNEVRRKDKDGIAIFCKIARRKQK